MELSEEDRQGMSPAEIEALTNEDAEANLRQHGAEEIEAAQREADEAARVAAAVEGAVEVEGEEGKEATAAESEEGKEGELNAADLAALLAAEEAPAVPPAPVPFKVAARDFQAEVQTVDTKIQAIDDKWSAGEMTDAERRDALKTLRTERDAIVREETKAEVLQEVNAQTAAIQQAATNDQINAACVSLMAQAKRDKTIDYSGDTDPTAAAEFDEFLQMHAKKSVGKSAAYIVNEAHKSMLAYRGIAAPRAATPPAPPARRDVPTATLSGIPAASPVGMENAVLDKLNGLSGEDYEEAFALLPQVEQDRIMRAADAGAMKFTKGTKRGASSRAQAEAVE